MAGNVSGQPAADAEGETRFWALLEAAWERGGADVQAVTDGSDDGFLYARGFIVAMGRDFYDAVTRNPQLAVMDAECEEMCYFFAHLYRARFGEFPETGSGISRESCSNLDGWAD